MATDPRYTKSAREGGIPRPQTFGDAFREARLAGDATFEFQGKTYTTKTAEEQGREIGARAAAGSGRGASAGRTAANRDTASESKKETPARPRASLSDIPGLLMRGMAEGAERVPAGRGLGAAFVGAGLPRAVAGARAGARVAEAAERRIEPMMATGRVRETGQFRSGSPSLREAQREAAEEMAREPAFKKGGKVKAPSRGRGAGCESRTKKTKYV